MGQEPLGTWARGPCQEGETRGRALSLCSADAGRTADLSRKVGGAQCGPVSEAVRPGSGKCNSAAWPDAQARARSQRVPQRGSRCPLGLSVCLSVSRRGCVSASVGGGRPEELAAPLPSPPRPRRPHTVSPSHHVCLRVYHPPQPQAPGPGGGEVTPPPGDSAPREEQKGGPVYC